MLKTYFQKIFKTADSGIFRERQNPIFLFTIFIFSFCVYLATWYGAFTGYEIEAVKSAESLLRGAVQIGRVGISMTIMYVPFILLQKIFSIGNANFLTLAVIFYSALTNSIIFILLKKLFRNAYSALLISALIAIGSMIWPYANIGMEYQATLFLALTLLALINYEQNGKGILWVGIGLGLLTGAKSYDILLFIPAAIYIFWTLSEKKQLKQIFKPSFLAALFLPALLFYGSAIFYNLWVYKSFSGAYALSVMDGQFKIDNWWDGFYGFFFSVGKGIFAFNPLLIISIFYWPLFLKEHKKTAWFIILSLILLLLANAPFRYWTDETWGPRKLLPVIPLLHLPLAYFLIKLKKKIFLAALIALSSAAIYAQFLGAAYFYGAQLNFLRNNGLDSLQNMRYVPQSSHLVLFHNFFASYLNHSITGQSADYRFYESDWSKWKQMKISGNIPYYEIKINLQQYEQPSMLWLRETENFNSTTSIRNKKIFLAFDLAVSLILFCVILRLFQKRPERNC